MYGNMNKGKNKTDYQLIAETFNVSPEAVRQALKRRRSYPNNNLVKAYDRLQKTKMSTLRKMVA
ncbi:hypothetical protein CAP35_13845 [Chitinophagaceae bacterium IBVUCB1]|nr:hypothetical protein CAP35_13845 [Chitinophagaceae bacterium IBVUCB1]